VSDEELFGDSGISTDIRQKKAVPRRYKVLLHNDDYSTMEFVVHILEKVFNKSQAEANNIMLNVHLKGVGLCGIYPFEVAETKVEKVHSMAEKESSPLKCSMEET
jgi:ATP-dependent Clp protease adaptor protein ClpS